MSSGYIPPKDEPDLDEVIAATKAALNENPRLAEMPAEEVARQLMLEGHLEKEPPPPLVAEALHTIEVRGQQ